MRNHRYGDEYVTWVLRYFFVIRMWAFLNWASSWTQRWYFLTPGRTQHAHLLLKSCITAWDKRVEVVERIFAGGLCMCSKCRTLGTVPMAYSQRCFRRMTCLQYTVDWRYLEQETVSKRHLSHFIQVVRSRIRNSQAHIQHLTIDESSSWTVFPTLNYTCIKADCAALPPGQNSCAQSRKLLPYSSRSFFTSPSPSLHPVVQWFHNLYLASFSRRVSSSVLVTPSNSKHPPSNSL